MNQQFIQGVIFDWNHIDKNSYINEIEAFCGIEKIDFSNAITFFVGENGSGKSTLLNIVGVLDYATEGEYTLDGISIKNLNDKKMAEIRNRKIGFVFQAYHLVQEMNVLENIAVPLGYAGMSKKNRTARAQELLDEFHMKGLEKKYPAQLSGGEQQRVSIMRAISNRPQILLADEPTGNLDSDNSRMVMEILSRLNKEGMTIIMVTHDLSLAKYGTRIIYIKDGKIEEHE